MSGDRASSARYSGGIPDDSRAAKPHEGLRREQVTIERLRKVRQLNAMAQARGQTLAQMALAWTLRQEAITSALMGASQVRQLKDNVAALQTLEFTEEELNDIASVLVG